MSLFPFTSMNKQNIKNRKAALRIQISFEIRSVCSYFENPSIFAGRPTHGNVGISNTRLVIFKVSNQMARHIVYDMYSIICGGRVSTTASFTRRRFNSKQEIHVVTG